MTESIGLINLNKINEKRGRVSFSRIWPAERLICEDQSPDPSLQ